VIVVALLTLLGMLDPAAVAAPPPAPAHSDVNRWAEPTRDLLAQHCGRCHLPNLPTSNPRALAIFNLTEEPWYGRMTPDQLDSLLPRARSIRELTDADRTTLESFVSCARDHVCPPADPR
jgi:hypothetical protein